MGAVLEVKVSGESEFKRIHGTTTCNKWLTQKAVSDRLQKSKKNSISALQLISISQISTQKYGSGHFDPFQIAGKFRPIRPENVEIIFLLNSKELNILF